MRLRYDLLAVCHKYYELLLHPSSPVYVAPSDIDSLGLFLRADIGRVSLKEGERLYPATLFGPLFEVDGEDFVELQDQGYPSLYGKPPSIMVGPASLINHRCDAELVFTAPSSIGFEEFANMKGVRIRAKTDTSLTGELMVDYFPAEGLPTGWSCRCNGCAMKNNNNNTKERRRVRD